MDTPDLEHEFIKITQRGDFATGTSELYISSHKLIVGTCYIRSIGNLCARHLLYIKVNLDKSADT